VSDFCVVWGYCDRGNLGVIVKDGELIILDGRVVTNNIDEYTTKIKHIFI